MAFSQLLSIWWSSYFFHSHGIFVNTSEKWTKDNFDSCWSPLKYQTSFFLFQNKLHNIAIAQLVNVLGVIIYNVCNKVYILNWLILIKKNMQLNLFWMLTFTNFVHFLIDTSVNCHRISIRWKQFYIAEHTYLGILLFSCKFQ